MRADIERWADAFPNTVSWVETMYKDR